MKPLLSILFIILLSWQGLYKAGFTIYWKLNQSYISQILCENKDKPQMHCNGKCYLKKQLNKVDEERANEKEIPFKILKLQSLDNFIGQFNHCFIGKNYLLLKQKSFCDYSFFFLLPGHHNTFFHPPELT